MQQVHEMMQAGSLKLPIEQSYPFEQFQSALLHHQRPRLGKVLLAP